MTTETELILDALKDLKEDIREIRKDQKEQGVSITDLCTRTSLNEESIKNHVKANVKSETKPFKVISIALTAVSTITMAIYYLKLAGLF